MLDDDEYPYALGQKGATKRKLAAASGAILEYVGHMACIAGYPEERKRGQVQSSQSLLLLCCCCLLIRFYAVC
jgi:hypothetical protein